MPREGFNYDEKYKQAITLFDDDDDDIFDGDFGLDDDDLPYIQVEITVKKDSPPVKKWGTIPTSNSSRVVE